MAIAAKITPFSDDMVCKSSALELTVPGSFEGPEQPEPGPEPLTELKDEKEKKLERLKAGPGPLTKWLEELEAELLAKLEEHRSRRGNLLGAI